MSKKKERKIKRLRRLSIWPAVVEMIITESIIMVFTLSICVLAIFGIVNTVIMQNVRENQTIVETVNKHWNKESRTKLQDRLTEYTNTYNDIAEIIIDERNDIIALFPTLTNLYTEEEISIFDKTGMVHFADPDSEKPFKALFSTLDKDIKSKRHHSHALDDLEDIDDWDDLDDFDDLDDIDDFDDLDNLYNSATLYASDNLGQLFYSPKFFFRSMNLNNIRNNPKYINWAGREITFLHIISVYKTVFPNVNVCIKNVFSINAFQFTLICFVLQFFMAVLVLTSIFEIKKIVNLVHERKRLNQLITTDPITGGYNKEYFMQKAGKEISRNRRQYAIVQLRLEKYRNFCTAYGLRQGENLLEEIYQHSRSILGKKEIIAHVEKSDFALLLEYQTSDELTVRIKNIMNSRTL